MTNEELVERVRKALYYALHSGSDEAQAEVAIRGIARIVANNLEQFHHIFAPYEPPTKAINTTQAMGQQIVQLTIERANLEGTVDRLTRKLRDTETQLRALQDSKEERPSPKRVFTNARPKHRLILDAVSSGCVSAEELVNRTGLRMKNLTSRLSEMANDRHFGGALLKRHMIDKTPTYELTDHARDLMNRRDYATYPEPDPGDHDAGRGDTDATGPSLHPTG